LDDSPRSFDEVRESLEPGEGRTLHGARGCVDCLKTGYAGRTGVFEVLRITSELRPLIAERRPTDELRDKAYEAGLLDLRRAALLNVARGLTNAEQVLQSQMPKTIQVTWRPVTAQPNCGISNMRTMRKAGSQEKPVLACFYIPQIVRSAFG